MKINNISTNKIFWFIFIIALCLRLVGITNELNDYHHFRQTYTAAFAKYFYENQNSLFSPNLDILNYKNVSEFQIYPYLVSKLYSIFGFKDYLGRIVSVIFSMLTFIMYYKLLRDYFNEKIALIGVAFFGLMPLSVFYSRVFMLEPMMLFLSVSMVYTFTKFQDTNSKFYLILSILFTSLTLLIKIPTVYMLIPILFLIYHKDKWKMFQVPSYYIYGLLSVAPAFYWYFIHAKLFPDNSIVDKQMMGLYYSSDAWDYYITLMKNPKTWTMIYLRSIGEFHLGISLFLFTIGGFIILFKKYLNNNVYPSIDYNSRIWMFFYWFLGFNLFIVSFIAPNLAHEYYQLPIILPAMAIASYYIYNIFGLIKNIKSIGLQKFLNVVHILMLVVLIPFLATKLKSRLVQDFFYNNFAEKIQSIVKETDKIIVIDNTPRTEVFYFSNRKGFQLIVPGIFQIYLNSLPLDFQKKYFDEVNEYISKDAKYIVTPYVELAGFAPWFYSYLNENYTCILGCDIDEKKSLLRDKSIPGYIFDLSKPKQKD